MPVDEDVNKPNLVVTLERTGATFANISQYSIQSSYVVSTDAFSFTAVDERNRDRLFGNEMESVELTIDGASQMLGRIEVTEGNGIYSRRFSGRDYLSDLVECHVDPQWKLGDGDSVERAILHAAGPCGIKTVASAADVQLRNVRSGRGKDGLVTAPDYRQKSMKEFKSKPGEGIYELINRIAARHHSTIQPGLSRDTISLEAPDFTQAATYRLRRREDGTSNNVLEGKAKRDFSSFPTLLIATARVGQASKTRSAVSYVNDTSFLRWTPGSARPRGSDADFRARDSRNRTTRARSYAPGALVEDPRKRATPKDGSGVSPYDMNKLAAAGYSDELANILSDTTVSDRIKAGQTLEDPRLLYRLHTYHDELARTQEQLESASLRRLAELLKPTLVYTCTVQGHRDPHSGSLWAVNTIAEIDDEVERVQEALWCVSRTFDYSGSSGRTTSLEFWRPSTFQL